MDGNQPIFCDRRTAFALEQLPKAILIDIIGELVIDKLIFSDQSTEPAIVTREIEKRAAQTMGWRNEKYSFHTEPPLRFQESLEAWDKAAAKVKARYQQLASEDRPKETAAEAKAVLATAN